LSRKVEAREIEPAFGFLPDRPAHLRLRKRSPQRSVRSENPGTAVAAACQQSE